MTASAQRESTGRRRSALGPLWLWTLVGLAGSILLTLAGSRLGGGSVPWWFHPRLGSDKPSQRLVFYLGIALLIAGWLGVGLRSRHRLARPRQMVLIAAAWCLPLALGAPLFSRDIYSYLAQGTIAHLGLSPYHAAPEVLSRLGQSHVLSAVDPFWRKATAPYGPLFLGVISLIAGATGTHLVAGALLIRAFDLLGFVLLAVFVPRLARRMGADPTRALWLAVASPLVLLQLVAPAHNDLLMAGVMVAGVCLGLERHPLLGVAVCALAATVKLPAIVGVAFIAMAWIRTEATWAGRGRRGLLAAATSVGVLALITLVTGFGTGWISSGLFSTPARVRLAITPSTDLSWTVAKLLGDVGVGVGFHTLHAVFRTFMFAASVVLALGLLLRTRRDTLVPSLGLALVAFAVAGPALWPWYLAWGLVLLAAWEPAQRSWLIVATLLIGALLVKPGGILALPLGSSPVLACLWLALAIVLWHRWRRRRRLGASTQRVDGIGSARSILVER
jgi:hypothetical protein